MFSSTLKRSVATVGVVAGLLAAAVPASASNGETINEVTLGLHEAHGVLDGNDGDDALFVVAPGPASVASGKHVEEGTQVGSEGVKLNTLGGDDSLDVVADAGSGDDKLRADSGHSARDNAPFTLDVVADAGSTSNLRGEAIDIIP